MASSAVTAVRLDQGAATVGTYSTVTRVSLGSAVASPTSAVTRVRLDGGSPTAPSSGRTIIIGGTARPLTVDPDFPGYTVIAPPQPDQFILGVTRPSRGNTGVTPGTVLRTMTPALAAEYGAVQAATTASCAKFLPKAGAVIEGFTIPWAINVTQPNVTFRNCALTGPQDITGGIATDTRNNPNMGVVMAHANNNTLNLVVDRCDIIPTITWSGSTGIIGHHYTATRNYIADVTDSFGVYNINGSVAGVKIRGNFAERMTFFNNDPRQSDGKTHNDVVQMQGGTDIELTGNFFKGVWSSRADIPTGSGTLDPMGSGLYVCNAAGGGGRLITGTPNVSPLGDLNIQYNWGLGGGTYSLVIPASQQASSAGLGIFANNRDYGYHRVVSLGGYTEGVGIAHHALMPWNSEWAGHAVGDRFADTTQGNQLFSNFNDTGGVQSLIRVQNS